MNPLSLKIYLIVLTSLILFACNPKKMEKPAYQTTLISVAEKKYVEQWTLTYKDLSLDTDAKWSIEKYLLKGGKQDGVDMIEVNNGSLQFSVIPTRGMSILQVNYEGITLGWDSPVKEVIHPNYVNLEGNGGLGWLDGFNEWMVRCGMEFAGHPGMDRGRLLTLHGKIGNIPASEVQVVIEQQPPHRIRIRGRMNERWFNGPQLELWTEISTVPGSNSFLIEDVLTNKAGKDQEFMVIYHANFGPPLLEKGSRLHGTVKKVVPFDEHAARAVQHWDQYDAPKLNEPEMVYCIYPAAGKEGNAHFLFHNAAGDKGISFSWPVSQLPYFTQWKNENSDGYVTGLEPGSGFPHNRSIERKYGRVPVLKGGESRSFRLEYTIHNGKEQVEKRLKDIQSQTNQEIEISTQVIEK